MYGAKAAEVSTYIMPGNRASIDHRDSAPDGGSNTARSTSGTNHHADAVVFEPRFTYMGFRYIEISGDAFSAMISHALEQSHATLSNTMPDGLPSLPVSVLAHFIHTDMEATGRVSTSSSLLNKVIRAAEYSQFGNWVSVPTDCTQRERRGWLGDAQIASEGQVHTSFAAAAYAKFLTDIGDTQVDEWAVQVLLLSFDCFIFRR